MEARVTKVLIDQTTRKAYGVEYVRNRRRYRVTALKEVIFFFIMNNMYESIVIFAFFNR